MALLQQLSQWQKKQASQEGIEPYMVLPFGALKEIAKQRPQTDEELLAIKGVGPVKVRKYSGELMTIIQQETSQISNSKLQKANKSQGSNEFHIQEATTSQRAPKHISPRKMQEEDPSLFDEAQLIDEILSDGTASQEVVQQNIDVQTGEIMQEKTEDAAISVSEFLTRFNQVVRSYFGEVRIRGEIIGFKRNQNGHAYFELKDEDAIIRCSVFRNAYDVSGVHLEDGLEVIVTGSPQHHARYGFSVIGSFVEVAGEGALKKAYDKLKKKLEGEGLMAGERKRSLPELPQKIGLITSPTGAAIGDFTMNVGKYGYQISFCPSTVEGARATQELLAAVRTLAKKDLDLLVITRGGGSLESLQAFNNEKLVRALADFPAPVIAGIGHEQDETLATLIADLGVSTPTAAAGEVRQSWDEAVERIAQQERSILESYTETLRYARETIENAEHRSIQYFTTIKTYATELFHSFALSTESIGQRIAALSQKLTFYEKSLLQNDPKRQLQLGYTITTNEEGKIVRRTADVSTGIHLKTRLSDGIVESEVI